MRINILRFIQPIYPLGPFKSLRTPPSREKLLNRDVISAAHIFYTRAPGFFTSPSPSQFISTKTSNTNAQNNLENFNIVFLSYKMAKRKRTHFAEQGRPQGRGNIPRNRKMQKMVIFSRAVQNDKSPGRSDKNGLNEFSIEILVCKFKNFSNILNLNWFLATTRKNLPLGFLISFRVTNDFQ